MKSIFTKPLFINPQAYTVIPELSVLSNALPFVIEGSYTVKIVTTGKIEGRIITTNKQNILHLDLYTVDGSCVLGEWYIDTKYQYNSVNVTKDSIVIQSNQMPIQLLNSIVCWYDIKKQNCTNKSMNKNPILKDLSGNGHDITCHNFAWSGMSGIGMYTNFYNDKSRADIEKLGEQHWYINSIFTGNSVNSQCILIATRRFPEHLYGKSLKIILTGNVLDGTKMTFSKDFQPNLYEGENIVEIPDKVEVTNNYVTFVFPLETTDIEVEVLPLYPDAIVSDGVDDYCYTEGLPILTDYTMITKRKWLDISESTSNRYLICNGDANTGRTVFEGISNASPNKKFVSNFGIYNYLDNFIESDIVWQTSEKYNGTPIARGSSTGSDRLFIGSAAADWGFSKAVMYSFILFNRVLTTEEIEWVKTNLIEQ